MVPLTAAMTPTVYSNDFPSDPTFRIVHGRPGAIDEFVASDLQPLGPAVSPSWLRDALNRERLPLASIEPPPNFELVF